ncbi:unnamed protein product [Rotaria sp. Silwood1]|nr:unnamed protein product [Rotaria sp. Silwood1]CAF1411258.1 unnamed protein product [Rotaria sp. Silwood1]
MAAWNWLSTGWSWLVTLCRTNTRTRTVSRLPSSDITCDTLLESNCETLRSTINSDSVYDLQDILSRGNRLEWCEWYLTFGEKDNLIKGAKQFHQEIEKSNLSWSIADRIDTIEETFLNFMPTDNEWNKIRKCFQEARQKDSPLPIIKAYTCSLKFSLCVNQHLAANTYHILKLYCTLFNCPILAQTQEYTEAFTSLLFHPKLDEFIVRNRTVYRGIVLKDQKRIANYKEGATIITTTFLSTSTDPIVAELFCTVHPEDMISISIFCTYNINNTRRRTALDLEKISNFGNEREILILRYIPFTIKSLERTNDGRRITICFDECEQ